MQQPRWDDARGAYRDCRWCHGNGCLQCKAELDKEYKRQFPDGPQPIAIFKTPEEIGKVKAAIGREAIEKAFGPGGGGVAEIIENLKQQV